jgi:NAD-dependent dihydropyrimidine dehydrogenase PreA subunit
MAYVVLSECIGNKDRSCVLVCPVDCFYDIKKKKYNDKYNRDPKIENDYGMLMINPNECINCGACESECPYGAIKPDNELDASEEEFLSINEEETVNMTSEEADLARCTEQLS